MEGMGPVQGLAATGHVAKPGGLEGAAKGFKLGTKAGDVTAATFSNVLSSQKKIGNSVAETISNNVKTRDVAQRFFTQLG